MNYYWHTPEGKIVMAAFDAKEEDALASPVSQQFACVGSEERYLDVDIAYVDRGQVFAMPTPPGRHHVWDYYAKNWIDPRTLDDIKAQQWGLVKRSRSVAEFGGFTWDGSGFDSDPKSQSRIQGASQLATLSVINGQSFSVEWTLADNTVRALSASDVIAVGVAMGAHIATAHETGRALRAAIDASTTQEEVEAVTWSLL